MLNEKEISDKLTQLSDVSIMYSKSSNMFYADLKAIEIKKGCMLHSISYHCKTPLEALQTTFTALMFANLIVKNAYGKDREEFKWSGDHFQKIV